MAIITNDSIVKTDQPRTLEANGAALADGAFGVANDASYNRDVDGKGARDATLDFQGQFLIAPDVNGVIYVHLRRLNINGTNNAQVPDANFTQDRVYIIKLNDVTTVQDAQIDLWDVPAEFDVHLENQAGQQLEAGWQISVAPKASGPVQ